VRPTNVTHIGKGPSHAEIPCQTRPINHGPRERPAFHQEPMVPDRSTHLESRIIHHRKVCGNGPPGSDAITPPSPSPPRLPKQLTCLEVAQALGLERVGLVGQAWAHVHPLVQLPMDERPRSAHRSWYDSPSGESGGYKTDAQVRKTTSDAVYSVRRCFPTSDDTGVAHKTGTPLATDGPYLQRPPRAHQHAVPVITPPDQPPSSLPTDPVPCNDSVRHTLFRLHCPQRQSGGHRVTECGIQNYPTNSGRRQCRRDSPDVELLAPHERRLVHVLRAHLGARLRLDDTTWASHLTKPTPHYPNPLISITPQSRSRAHWETILRSATINPPTP
jgi:hypothetical protein